MRKFFIVLLLTTGFVAFGATESSAAFLTNSKQPIKFPYERLMIHDVFISNLVSWDELEKGRSKLNWKISSQEGVVSASAYTANCNGCSGITETGIHLKRNPNTKVITVNPNLMQLGEKVYVEGYGFAIVSDTDSRLKRHEIEVFFATKSEAFKWGLQDVKIKIIE